MGRATGCNGRYENDFDVQSVALSFSCPRWLPIRQPRLLSFSFPRGFGPPRLHNTSAVLAWLLVASFLSRFCDLRLALYNKAGDPQRQGKLSAGSSDLFFVVADLLRLGPAGRCWRARFSLRATRPAQQRQA